MSDSGSSCGALVHTVSLHCLTDVVFISCPKPMLPHLDASIQAEIKPYRLSHLTIPSDQAHVAHLGLCNYMSQHQLSG